MVWSHATAVLILQVLRIAYFHLLSFQGLLIYEEICSIDNQNYSFRERKWPCNTGRNCLLPIYCRKVLIHLDGWKNLSHKPKRYKRTHWSTNQEDGKTHQKHVSKVKQIGEEHLTGLKRLEPNNAITKEIERYTSTGHKGKPPPAMIFVDELVVNQQHSHLCTAQKQNEENNKGESKDIVVLLHP